MHRVNATYCFTFRAVSHRNFKSDAYSNDDTHAGPGTNPQHRGYRLSYDQNDNSSYANGYAHTYLDTDSFINSYTYPGARANPHVDPGTRADPYVDPKTRANTDLDLDTDHDAEANADRDAYTHANSYAHSSDPNPHASRATHTYPCANTHNPSNSATAPVCLPAHVGRVGHRRWPV
ncbi:MAG: hypothetical protein J4O03_03045 [Chloroflexi bacterium]|nr:hypothetical protein [Chloroflexota bacterium]